MADNPTILGGEDNAAIVDTPVVVPAAGDNAPADNTSQSFDYTKMVTADGGLAENWREALPEDIRNERCLDSIKTVGTLAKSFVSAQKMIGANKIALPGENATADEIDAFHRALGRPDKQDDYSVEGIELPEGIELDDQLVNGFREYAFKHGMSQKDFAEAIAFDVQRVANSMQAQQQAAAEEYNTTLGKLKTEWGESFDQNIAQCNKALTTFGLMDLFEEKGLLNNYDAITALTRIGAAMSESKLKGGEFTTPTDPQSQLDEIISNPDHAYYKKDHPGHDAAVRRVNELLTAQARAQQAARK
jgi:hypothetical protein